MEFAEELPAHGSRRRYCRGPHGHRQREARRPRIRGRPPLQDLYGDTGGAEEVRGVDNMIEVFFDNSALKMLFSRADFDSFAGKVKSLGRRQKLRVWFSFVNFQERLLGANQHNFGKVQTFLKRAYKLTGGAILLAPEPHLKMLTTGLPWLNVLTEDQVAREVSFWTELFRALIKCTTFDEFRKIAEPIKNYIVNFKADIQQGAEGLKQEMSNSRMGAISRNGKLVFAKNPQELLRFRQQLFLMKLNSWHVIKEGTDLDLKQLTLLFPSVLYSVDVNLHYYSRMFSGSITPKSSDHFDFEQVIYLDRCDYMVTEDRHLIGLTENCGNPELSGRAILFDQLDQR